MRNYIILNGVKSTTINGLLIQSLPAISRPLMRTQVEEIDGRDGDIVTTLGYSAYDKTVKVGLYGDYNVDDVIGYFDRNSEGTVIFSNESDKFYNYQITNQIDFERLIRFREAEVTFHVQPFKYSAVEKGLSFNNNYVSVKDFTKTTNGITVTSSNGVVSVKGKGLVASEFYVPLTAQSVESGNYTLNATVQGTTGNVCSIRLIKSAPSNNDSFGGNYLPLMSNDTVTLDGNISSNTVYGYLWFYMNPNQQMDFTLNVSLTNNNFNDITVRNMGNVKSKPSITIYGDDEIMLYINAMQVLTMNVSGYITVDATAMNAYKGDMLVNRNVQGDYDNLVLNMGKNTISWTGNVSAIEVSNFSRWL